MTKLRALATSVVLTALSVTATQSIADGNADSSNDWYMSTTLGYVIADEDRARDFNTQYAWGLRAIIGRPLNDKFNIEGNLFGHLFERDNSTNSTVEDRWVYGVGADILFMPSRAEVSPYLLAGPSLALVQTPTGDESFVMANVGVGALWRIADNGTSLRTEARWRHLLDDKSQTGEDAFDDWEIGIGVKFPFGLPDFSWPSWSSDEPVAMAAVEVDSDGDGVMDGQDACPATPAGVAVDSSGCVAETDGDYDGVFDSADRCPNTPTGQRVDAVGCTIDTDNDGIPNDRDRCPNSRTAVRVDNNGCELPEVLELRGVNFKTGSTEFEGAYFAGVLNEIASILHRYPRLRVEIAGHTDNTGDADANVELSRRRAERVRSYLLRTGIDGDRLTVEGYGSDQPIATNDTEEGRMLNRRVEMRMFRN